MAKKFPYLHRRADTDGYFFIRRVPADLKEKMGLTTWQRLLAHDFASARLRLPKAVAEADRSYSRYEGQRPYSPFRVLLGGPSVVRWMYVFYMADWNFFVS